MRECRHESSVGILESLRRGDSVQVKAHGFSMWPSYRDGVVVEVFPCDLGHVRIGDVVLVKVSERILLHRVVGRCGKGIVTKGDARRRSDGVIPPERLFGRVARRREDRILGHFSGVFGSPLWILSNIYRQFFDRIQGPL